MSKHRPNPIAALLVRRFEVYTLRRLAQLTGIGKNRLHRLRRDPESVRLSELILLDRAKIIHLTMSSPCGTTARIGDHP